MRLAYPVASEDCRCNVKAYTDGFAFSFQTLKQQGYEGVELLVKNPDTMDWDKLERELGRCGLKLAAVGTSPMQIEEKLFLIHPDEENRQEARRRLSCLLERCARYHVPFLLGKYRGQLGPEPDCSVDSMRNMLESVCEEACRLGTEVLLEPQSPGGINNINTIADGLEWIETLQCEKLGLHADIYHMGITEPSVCDSLRLAAPKIGFIHMSDSDRKAPGDGTMDLALVMETLKDISYKGYLSPEIDQTPNSHEASKRSIQFIKQYL